MFFTYYGVKYRNAWLTLLVQQPSQWGWNWFSGLVALVQSPSQPDFFFLLVASLSQLSAGGQTGSEHYCFVFVRPDQCQEFQGWLCLHSGQMPRLVSFWACIMINMYNQKQKKQKTLSFFYILQEHTCLIWYHLKIILFCWEGSFEIPQYFHWCNAHFFNILRKHICSIPGHNHKLRLKKSFSVAACSKITPFLSVLSLKCNLLEHLVSNTITMTIFHIKTCPSFQILWFRYP